MTPPQSSGGGRPRPRQQVPQTQQQPEQALEQQALEQLPEQQQVSEEQQQQAPEHQQHQQHTLPLYVNAPPAAYMPAVPQQQAVLPIAAAWPGAAPGSAAWGAGAPGVVPLVLQPASANGYSGYATAMVPMAVTMPQGAAVMIAAPLGAQYRDFPIITTVAIDETQGGMCIVSVS